MNKRPIKEKIVFQRYFLDATADFYEEIQTTT